MRIKTMGMVWVASSKGVLYNQSASVFTDKG